MLKMCYPATHARLIRQCFQGAGSAAVLDCARHIASTAGSQPKAKALIYKRKVVAEEGFEPPTHGL